MTLPKSTLSGYVPCGLHDTRTVSAHLFKLDTMTEYYEFGQLRCKYNSGVNTLNYYAKS